jgi:hypothetical protein
MVIIRMGNLIRYFVGKRANQQICTNSYYISHATHTDHATRASHASSHASHASKNSPYLHYHSLP